MARRDDGSGVDPADGGATRWTAEGALLAIGAPPWAIVAAQQALMRVVGPSIGEWNDAARTKAEVLAGLESAAQLAERSP